MKRIVKVSVLIILCLALLAMAAAPAMARQAGKSPVYQYEVTDPTGDKVGQITINTADAVRSYIFNGHGLQPGLPYSLYVSTGRMVNSGVADAHGNLHLRGLWLTLEDLETAGFGLSSCPPSGASPGLKANFTLDHNRTEVVCPSFWCDTYEVYDLNYSSSTGSVTGADLDILMWGTISGGGSQWYHPYVEPWIIPTGDKTLEMWLYNPGWSCVYELYFSVHDASGTYNYHPVVWLYAKYGYRATSYPPCGPTWEDCVNAGCLDPPFCY